MGTSETYVKMCDCHEIQKQAIYDEFNYFVCAQTKKLRHSHPNDYSYMKNMNLFHKKQEYIWLPRQDQIQKMMGKTDLAFCLYQDDIGDEWGGELYRDREQIFDVEADSPEQVWLAFYMYEKHNLIWENDKWVKK